MKKAFWRNSAMKKNLKTALAVLVVCVVIGAAWSKTSYGLKLGGKVQDVLKGAAIVLLTNALSDELDKFINTVTLNNGVPAQADTKVVPIIAFGSGTRVGAGQVVGPKELVDKVKVLVQIETKFSLKNLDIEVFVPSDSMNPLKFNRVEGVGVSALIDLRLSGI